MIDEIRMGRALSNPRAGHLLQQFPLFAPAHRPAGRKPDATRPRERRVKRLARVPATAHHTHRDDR
jgi:hypothetical protein